MNEKITTFLSSGLLDRYLVGETNVVETEQVEAYISKYPEVENAYNTMQHNLEIVAKSNAIEAPASVLDNVLEALDDAPVIALQKVSKYKKWYKFSVAASVAALVFAASTYLFYNQNQKLEEENQTIVDEIFDLRSDIEMNNRKVNEILEEFRRINDPETYKYIMQGNHRAKDLKTVAYINPKEKTSMIDVVSLPQLPEEQCYQIWADLQGRMVSLGILNENDSKKYMPFAENAVALNITIEPKGGNTIASLENSVAEISLQ
ncbi:MAG: anti-sigma factor [Jejuia sp.]